MDCCTLLKLLRALCALAEDAQVGVSKKVILDRKNPFTNIKLKFEIWFVPYKANCICRKTHCSHRYLVKNSVEISAIGR